MSSKIYLKILSLVFIFLFMPFLILKIFGISLNGSGVVLAATDSLVCKKNDEFRGIWFSFIEWQQLHNGKNAYDWAKTVENEIIPNLKSLRINNVFVHAVAHSDSFYDSKLYPTSNAVSKEYGRSIDYDAFKIFINKLKENGFFVHAWINPLRAMTDAEFKKVPDNPNYLTKMWYNSPNRGDYYMKDSSGRFWLNPANEEVLSFIKNVVEEILRKYNNLDGLHIDDYFYPTGLSEDKLTENDLNFFNRIKPNVSINDWRRQNVTALVKQIYDVCALNKKTFGISPQGNMKNNFDKMFFDQKDIISKGYLDYVMPQIYYGFENENCPFKDSVEEWKKLVIQNKPKEKNVNLILGLAAYKCGMDEDVYAGKGKKEWRNNKDILKRQIEFERSSGCFGFCLFSYNSFFIPEENKKQIILQEKDNLVQILV